jgi:drug/metabolite transporter (DMT)-like permease
LAVVCVAWSSTYLAIRFVVLDVPPVAAGAIRFACSGLIMSAIAAAWLGFAYLVLFGSIIGFTAYVHAVNELPASVVGIYTYVTPVGALLLGHVFLDEALPASLMVGAALIFGAVLLCSSRPREAEPQSDASLVAKATE